MESHEHARCVRVADGDEEAEGERRQLAGGGGVRGIEGRRMTDRHRLRLVLLEHLAADCH